DDYISKPFDILELRLRIQNILRRTQRNTVTNPITGLPDSMLVDDHLESWLDNNEQALVIISIKNLNRFRDIYGLSTCDDFLRVISMLIKSSMEALKVQEYFLGHLSAEVFVLFLSKNLVTIAEVQLERRLHKMLDYLYNIHGQASDVLDGKLVSVNIEKMLPGTQKIDGLQDLKTKLEILCR
ncbi:MAG: diguanylate cyclase, partial [Anaerolineaceae bacterium]|nr:diguanylate cyclase [Anaerolineaceae bacterium]